ncbi:uncharacterized protein PFL1_04519 [Pseudozyma flocculosa PF-1]|uniref:Uncharacterized protein n=1 Tax=Pseudozyma flocculosa PF-1 TaxID=1277687 RepID=A0A061H5P0_9BASI|nr:uncharacterized protein PFL1_04519 [Pseudozyma flocculosa PF-1]EPQ27774.1 hypothetical protein PFL1_04519 [Pseudozyma flocculosa PF-1]
MARGASKKTSSANATQQAVFTYGFVGVNAFHVLLRFVLLRHRLTWGHAAKYAFTEAIALLFWSQLLSAARGGEDITGARGGLTGYMVDVIYVTWFTHFLTAWMGRWGWWVYAVIPMYAIYVAYQKVLLPYVFKGQSPFAALSNLFSSSSRTGAGGNAAAAAAAQGQPTSKRQAKLQARADRGDPRVQVRRR